MTSLRESQSKMDRDGWSREAEDRENFIMFNLNPITIGLAQEEIFWKERSPFLVLLLAEIAIRSFFNLIRHQTNSINELGRELDSEIQRRDREGNHINIPLPIPIQQRSQLARRPERIPRGCWQQNLSHTSSLSQGQDEVEFWKPWKGTKPRDQMASGLCSSNIIFWI